MSLEKEVYILLQFKVMTDNDNVRQNPILMKSVLIDFFAPFRFVTDLKVHATVFTVYIDSYIRNVLK